MSTKISNLFFRNGQKQEYSGGRTKDTIVSWIMKKTGPVSQEISCGSVASMTSENKLSLVYFGSFEGEMYDSFINVAGGDEKFTFMHTSGDCASAHGAQIGSVSVFRSFDESPVHYGGSADGL